MTKTRYHLLGAPSRLLAVLSGSTHFKEIISEVDSMSTKLYLDCTISVTGYRPLASTT